MAICSWVICRVMPDGFLGLPDPFTSDRPAAGAGAGAAGAALGMAGVEEGVFGVLRGGGIISSSAKKVENSREASNAGPKQQPSVVQLPGAHSPNALSRA